MAETLIIRFIYIGLAGFSGWLFFLLWLPPIKVRPAYCVMLSVWLGFVSFCLLDLGKYAVHLIQEMEAEPHLEILDLNRPVDFVDVLIAVLIAVLLGLICAGLARMKRWKSYLSIYQGASGKDNRVKCFLLDRIGYEVTIRDNKQGDSLTGRLEDAAFHQEHIDLLLSSVSVCKNGEVYEVERLYVTKHVQDLMIEFHDWELQAVSRKHKVRS